MCFLLILLPTQKRDFILLDIILNNSLRGLHFLFRTLWKSTISILSCSPNCCLRVSSPFIPHERYILCFVQHIQAVTTAVLPSCPFSSTCVTPGISRCSRPEREPSHKYNCVFLALRRSFLFQPRVFPRAVGSVARMEPVRTPQPSLGPARGPRHVLRGSKWHVRSGTDSEHVEPFRPLHTHKQVKRISDVSYDTWDLECHQCRQAILVNGKVFPRCQNARHATTFNTTR